MRGHTLLMAAAACGILVGSSACHPPKLDYRDGARCSSTGTCPPGQQCSPDGMCLKPCPTKNCTGTDCGCSELSHKWHKGAEYVCQPDGLCHLGCDGQTVLCPENKLEGFVCDTDEGVCRLHCDTSGVSDGGLGTCPPGAECVPFDNWSSVCVECTDCDAGVGH